MNGHVKVVVVLLSSFSESGMWAHQHVVSSTRIRSRNQSRTRKWDDDNAFVLPNHSPLLLLPKQISVGIK